MRLADLAKMPVAEIDLLALKAAGLVPSLAKRAKVIKTGKLDKAVKLTGMAATQGRQGGDRGGWRQRGLNRRTDNAIWDNLWPTANPALKSGDKYGDLKRRLWFLLGALVVYRIGAHIPVPGIDAQVLDELFQQAAGRHPGHVQHVLGRRAARFTDLRPGDHAVHLGVDHHAAVTVVVAAAGGAEEGRARRGGARSPSTRATATVVLSLFQALGISVALESQPGLVLEPGLSLPA